MVHFLNYKSQYKTENWNSINSTSKHFIDKNFKNVYSEIFKLFKIYLSIPVSSAEAERSFSCPKRLKTWLRNSMRQERLYSLAIINCEGTDNLNYEEVLEKFVSQKDRRMTFF